MRITTGVTAGVVSLALALLLTSSPEVSERFRAFRAEDHASDAFIFAWALVALPVAGVLHTPLALARRARIGAGWALIASSWLYVVLMAAVAWQVRDFFPAPDSPGKAGGMFGGAILMVIGTPVLVVGSGGVFREVREVRSDKGSSLSPQIRDQLTAVTALCCTFLGAVTGMVSGFNFSFPHDGYPAMFLPGGLLWGALAGAALGMRAGALITNSPDSRRRMTADAKSFARTAASMLACCLCVSQLGWLLPVWAVALIGLPAPLVLFVVAERYERLGRWVEFRQIEVPKEAMY
ncbi:hypothetical protein [Streptomyces coeruleorubidus]|uniref:Uncharacterized protein n=1 Tax=Streptomyces coeruleorubidus TaxID=116188 RepID=A0A5J6I8Y9_STRC4|nr:hypothetical protein [Streptomyces coeruleorubidus]QEV27113.1 hypothetical protein CP976_25305 [Streptomyces coeruleorubidus]